MNKTIIAHKCNFCGCKLWTSDLSIADGFLTRGRNYFYNHKKGFYVCCGCGGKK